MSILDSILSILSQFIELFQLLNIITEFLRYLGLS
jgi:hypothetical protein